jgi:hypothetical protein
MKCMTLDTLQTESETHCHKSASRILHPFIVFQSDLNTHFKLLSNTIRPDRWLESPATQRLATTAY